MRMLLIGLILCSCTAAPARLEPESARPASSEAAATASAAPAEPTVPRATAAALPGAPIVLGSAAGAGVLAFPVGDKVWSFDAEARQIKSLGERSGTTRPAPDGHGYYVQGESDRGAAGLRSYYDTRADAAPPLALPQFMHLSDFELSPDGKSVAYVGEGRSLFLSLAGGPLRPIGEGQELIDPRWSPDGSRLLVQKCQACGALGAVMTLVLWERATGSLLDLYEAPPSRGVSPVDQPMSGLFTQFFQIHSWSPDGRYVVGWVMNASGSGADLRKDEQVAGRQLLVFDVAARKAFVLGPASVERSFVAWGPPHQLAYVSGPGWDSWDAKTLRTWTPEQGAVDVFPTGSIALAPSWSDSGDLYFIYGGWRGVTAHSPAEWAAGLPPDSVGVGFVKRGERVVRTVQAGPPTPSALRVAHDGEALLVVSTAATGPEIHYVDLAASTSTPLLRLDRLQSSTRPDLSAVAWSR